MEEKKQLKKVKIAIPSILNINLKEIERRVREKLRNEGYSDDFEIEWASEEEEILQQTEYLKDITEIPKPSLYSFYKKNKADSQPWKKHGKNTKKYF